MHHVGECGPQDHAEARRLDGLAAAQGRADAQFRLAVMHRTGKGGPQDHAEARRLYGLAAAQGDAKAQYNLGQCYETGQGVAKSLKKAKRLYKLAAKQGFAPSHAALAQLEAASGKDADVQKAQKHIRNAQAAMAAGDGSDEAYSSQLRSVAQSLLQDAKLASLLRCGNEGCSVACSEDASVQSVKLKSCARCRRVAYCSVECQTADWKARHKHECGKRLEEGESFVLCKWASRPELNGCRVEVVRGMDEATRRVVVRVVAGALQAAVAAGAAEDGDDGDDDEEERKAEGGSESEVGGDGRLVLSVQPQNLKRSM